LKDLDGRHLSFFKGGTWHQVVKTNDFSKMSKMWEFKNQERLPTDSIFAQDILPLPTSM
jgi:hypothetical protein